MPDKGTVERVFDDYKGLDQLVHYVVLVGWVDSDLRSITNAAELMEQARVRAGINPFHLLPEDSQGKNVITKQDVLFKHLYEEFEGESVKEGAEAVPNAKAVPSRGMRWLEKFMLYQGRPDLLVLRDVMLLHKKVMDMVNRMEDWNPGDGVDMKNMVLLMDAIATYNVKALTSILPMLHEMTQKCTLAHYSYEELKEMFYPEQPKAKDKEAESEEPADDDLDDDVLPM